MWWGKGSDNIKKPAEGAQSIPNSTIEAVSSPAEKPAFDPNKHADGKKITPKLQNIIDMADKEENFFDELVEGYAPPSTESNVRYAAYAARFRTILTSLHRYVAYTSDIGESFRPVAQPYLVRSAYGISWAYILGDVGYEGYKAYWHNQQTLNPGLQLTERQQKATGMGNKGILDYSDGQVRQHQQKQQGNATTIGTKTLEVPKEPGRVVPLEDWRTVMIQRCLFQSLASMGLPAFTIHSVVRYSGQAVKKLKNKTIRTWAPIGLGLSVVPLLPTLFDKPVENAVEWVFHKGFEAYGGREAVGEAPVVGREKQLSVKPEKKDL